mmetsp:Transcript_21974/g.65899  ORF Transcript_21974/g.65899 Transcript_21974/m.65899 type:complete len:94 (-) Transcript_21974:132-413(-)
MVNNRVFEALAVGRPLIMEAFPALEALFADLPGAKTEDALGNLLLWRKPGDVARHAEALDARDDSLGSRTRAFINGSHTYRSRVETIKDAFRQ